MKIKLGEFIKNFSHNNLIRLVYKGEIGYETVANDWGDLSMDWEINKASGVFRHYVDNNVIGLVSIATGGNYPEAINIIIEKLENQPFVEEIKKEENNEQSV